MSSYMVTMPVTTKAAISWMEARKLAGRGQNLAWRGLSCCVFSVHNWEDEDYLTYPLSMSPLELKSSLEAFLKHNFAEHNLVCRSSKMVAVISAWS